MPAAVEAITNLTAVTETANVLAKASSSFIEMISKALSTIVNMFIQPLAPLFIYFMQKIYMAMLGFKEWWDNLPAWIDENLFKPVVAWIQKYILDPIEAIKKWINDYLVKPFWAFIDGAKKWIDDTLNWWRIAIENIPKWIEDNLVKPFWEWVSNAKKWIKDNLETPFWNMVNSITLWIDTYITQPFWKAVKDISDWIKKYISDPFLNAINTIYGYVDTFIGWVKTSFHSIVNTIIGAINWLLNQIRTLADKVGLGGLVPADLPPWLDKGGYVQETGVAVVHKGETVTPSGAGQNITLNFYGYQDEKFVQKVKDVLRSQGTVYNL